MQIYLLFSSFMSLLLLFVGHLVVLNVEDVMRVMLMLIPGSEQAQETDGNVAREQSVRKHASLSNVVLTNVRLAELEWET